MTVNRLDEIIKLLEKKSGRRQDLRPYYEQALSRQGWSLEHSLSCSSYWSKGNKRMCVERGDRVLISFDEVSWKPLNPHARKNILLGAQAQD